MSLNVRKTALMKLYISTLFIAIAATSSLFAAEPLKVDGALLTVIEQVELPAKEAGAISELLVREGDAVKAQQLLAKVEDDAAVAALAKARFELEIATAKAKNDVSVRYSKKAAEVAHADYQRAKDSLEQFKKSVSATEMDQLRLTAERSELEIEQAQEELAIARLTEKLHRAELNSAEIDVRRRQTVAPFDGMVVQVKKQRGEWVNPGDTILRIMRLDRLRVETFLPARE
ncbi:MAG: HlyD family efflux transporter periplasmic adaptor subunit, partial [Planctomycetota bacterium]|nr:HlyD family efflux transporter periplasmic adaptor subunit [Planctomycetota bacterium]